MKLHKNKEEFLELISIVAPWIGVPEEAVKRDYYIVKMLKLLSESEFADTCVFKGGTSLSKCYPGSIERFSEDIDLTYVPTGELSNKQYDRALKKVEKIMSQDGTIEKIDAERNDRNKSAYVFFEDNPSVRIKLEIGSSVRPDPYSKRKLQTYIQDYLEAKGMPEAIREYELSPVEINVLGIERTFIDKVMSVKRHAYSGTLPQKVRHIYDVRRLVEMPEIKALFQDKEELKRIVRLTKETDSFYLEKRGLAAGYDPTTKYAFDEWRHLLGKDVQDRYESLHQDLLYTNEKQNFNEAIEAFESISNILSLIGE